ncbi:MAG: RNA methyltransferase [Bacteroidia bacterium]|nr:RNA methyltransferase [Bacteroidia bacterium]MCX7651495.1 RNA methyltransferase [Bacteroidia bacterium]MDW8416750.1 RNA methyltransferase [Bacteroidia bacterium]
MRRPPHPLEFYRRLHESRHRYETGLFLAPGKKLFWEALRSLPLERFHCIFYGEMGEHPTLPEELKEKCYRLPNWQIERLSGQDTPEGIVSVLYMPPESRVLDASPAILAERLQDPGNLGTLLRSMEWFGYEQLWLTADSADPFSPKAVRASMGSVFRLRVQRVKDWSSLLTAYEGRCVVATMQGMPIHEVPWSKLDSLYIGSEAHGVNLAPPHWMRVSIPPSSTSRGDSLNVAVAATLLLFVRREIIAGRLHTLPPL